MNNLRNSIENQQNILLLMDIYKECIIKCDFLKKYMFA